MSRSQLNASFVFLLIMSTVEDLFKHRLVCSRKDSSISKVTNVQLLSTDLAYL
jgi:hypothetical protein